jgi:hypothetical protein
MKEFFLKPLERKKDHYQFAHEVDLDYNDISWRKLSYWIFDNPVALYHQKKSLATCL